MIVETITANLLAETTYTLDDWREGATQRSRQESFQVGGKGINVTRMLTRFGVGSEAILFPGGATGVRCEAWLRSAGIPHRSFPTPAETRTGAVVRAPGRAETTFLGVENDVSREAIEACSSYLLSLKEDSLLVISGSVPRWQDARWDSFRRAVLDYAVEHKVYVDTYGAPLEWFAEKRVRLIKINRREFSGIVQSPETSLTEESMPRLLAEVVEATAPGAWVITDGPNPVWCASKSEAPFSVVPPRIEEVSATGSGDVFMAGCVYGLEFKKLSLREAVAFALPMAAANAASPGVADFDLAPFGF